MWPVVSLEVAWHFRPLTTFKKSPPTLWICLLIELLASMDNFSPAFLSARSRINQNFRCRTSYTGKQYREPILTGKGNWLDDFPIRTTASSVQELHVVTRLTPWYESGVWQLLRFLLQPVSWACLWAAFSEALWATQYPFNEFLPT